MLPPTQLGRPCFQQAIHFLPTSPASSSCHAFLYSSILETSISKLCLVSPAHHPPPSYSPKFPSQYPAPPAHAPAPTSPSPPPRPTPHLPPSSSPPLFLPGPAPPAPPTKRPPRPADHSIAHLRARPALVAARPRLRLEPLPRRRPART